MSANTLGTIYAPDVGKAVTSWWARRDWLTILTVLLAVGLLVACWFIAHGEALRWVVVS